MPNARLPFLIVFIAFAILSSNCCEYFYFFLRLELDLFYIFVFACFDLFQNYLCFAKSFSMSYFPYACADTVYADLRQKTLLLDSALVRIN